MTTAFVEASASWVAVVGSVLDAPDDLARMTDEGLRAEAREAARLESRIASRRLARVRELERRQVAKSSGASSTGSLLARDFGGNRSAGDRAVRTAQNLASATLTDKALAAGEISVEQAEIVARAVAGLPDSLDEHTRVRVEKKLLSDARLFTIADLRRRVLRVADLYAPKPEADADENARLVAQERRAWANTEFWMGPARDGLVAFGGKIPAVQADLLKNSLDAVAAPRRRHLTDEGADPDLELTNAQRLGRAFCTWIEHLPTDGFPTSGGTPATIAVTIDHDTLIGDLQNAGTLATGTRISAGEARRLACKMGILPQVLGGASIPLDLGRSQRLFTRAQRLALAQRDHGCTYPGCDRPPAWCETQHIHPWAHGGTTDLTNGALLCAFHHHHVHTQNIPMRIIDNTVELKLHGTWRRNHRWRT